MEYRKAERKLWKNDSVVLGYWKQHSTLTHVAVRNAGHMVPHDAPLAAFSMFQLWMDGKAP